MSPKQALMTPKPEENRGLQSQGAVPEYPEESVMTPQEERYLQQQRTEQAYNEEVEGNEAREPDSNAGFAIEMVTPTGALTRQAGVLGRNIQHTEEQQRQYEAFKAMMRARARNPEPEVQTPKALVTTATDRAQPAPSATQAGFGPTRVSFSPEQLEVILSMVDKKSSK